MKLWHKILLIIGVLVAYGGLLGTILFPGLLELHLDNPFDNPKYAPGEASAMVQRVYGWDTNDLTETYLGQGIWVVKSLRSYYGSHYVIVGHKGEESGLIHNPFEPSGVRVYDYGQAIFKVYETSGTVEVCNDFAKTELERRGKL